MASVLGYELDAQIIILFVGAVSGWIAVVITYLSGRPKIRGKILQVMRGTFPNPERRSEVLTSFVLFLYLTNARKSPVHLVDYELQIDAGEGFQGMKIVRSGPDMAFHFEYSGSELQIPDFNRRLLYRQGKSIVFGTPFIGFLMFGGDAKYYKSAIREFRLTCTDVFGHKHRVIAEPDEFRDLAYIQDMFGVTGLIPDNPPQMQQSSPATPHETTTPNSGQGRQSMTRYEKRAFEDEDVLLDGHEYINCRFNRCRILFGASGPVNLTGNGFSECKWEFTGAAAQTLAFLKAMYTGGGRDLVDKTLEDVRR